MLALAALLAGPVLAAELKLPETAATPPLSVPAAPSLAAPLSSVTAGAALPAAATLNITAEYHAARADTRAASPSAVAQAQIELERLRGYKVLLVPGFMSGAFIRLSRTLGKDPQPWHYFGRQMRWLADNGVEHELVGVHTEQTPERNAPIIAERVRASDKPVILVTHSNGGPHALAALLKLRREGGLSRVAGWIPAQAPFLGSPVADLVQHRKGLRFWIARFLEHPAIGGSRRTLERMTTGASERFNARNREEIAEVLAAVPTIAFTSQKEVGLVDMLRALTRMGLSLHPVTNPRLLFSPLLGLTAILKGVGATLAWFTPRSDGLVPASSGRLPGMPYVEEDGVDHFVPFVGHHGQDEAFDRLAMTQALLKLLLRRVPETPAQK